MTSTPEQSARRNRVVNRMSVMGQVTALVAVGSTGLIAGVLAHDAQVKDLAAAEQARAAVPPPAPAVRLVPRPIRTVLIRVPAPAQPRTASTSSVRRTPTVARRRVVARVAAPAPVSRPAPRRTSHAAATTSTGS